MVTNSNELRNNACIPSHFTGWLIWNLCFPLIIESHKITNKHRVGSGTPYGNQLFTMVFWMPHVSCACAKSWLQSFVCFSLWFQDIHMPQRHIPFRCNELKQKKCEVFCTIIYKVYDQSNGVVLSTLYLVKLYFGFTCHQSPNSIPHGSLKMEDPQVILSVNFQIVGWYK